VDIRAVWAVVDTTSWLPGPRSGLPPMWAVVGERAGALQPRLLQETAMVSVWYNRIWGLVLSPWHTRLWASGVVYAPDQQGRYVWTVHLVYGRRYAVLHGSAHTTVDASANSLGAMHAQLQTWGMWTDGKDEA
jgi:hypothetical protein